jgi:spore coat protein CotH
MNWELQVPSSVYIYKDSTPDSKISIGPLWDFDCGFGYGNDSKNVTYFKEYQGKMPNFKQRDGHCGQQFFNRFFGDPVFLTTYKERWNEKYSDIMDIIVFIDEMADKLDRSQQANYRVWQKRVGINYKQEIEHMKTWFIQRITYLGSEINKY